MFLIFVNGGLIKMAKDEKDSKKKKKFAEDEVDELEEQDNPSIAEETDW